MLSDTVKEHGILSPYIKMSQAQARCRPGIRKAGLHSAAARAKTARTRTRRGEAMAVVQGEVGAERTRADAAATFGAGSKDQARLDQSRLKLSIPCYTTLCRLYPQCIAQCYIRLCRSSYSGVHDTPPATFTHTINKDQKIAQPGTPPT